MTYFDPMGEPIGLMEWARLFERRSEDMSDDSWWRRRTEIGSIEVSTVWLGIDHNFGDDGPPLIWETMIFGDEEDDQDQRHTTRGEAMDAHEEIVRSIRARLLR